MNESDAAKFEATTATMFKTLGHEPPSKDVMRVWWKAMRRMSIEQFMAACGRYVMESTRLSVKFPVPAAILDIAGFNKSAWPTAEEAWNMAPKSESESGWMCQEIAIAIAACEDSLSRADFFAARKCFLEVYTREITGKPMGAKPEWWISSSTTTDYETRQAQRAMLLEIHPDRRKDLTKTTTAIADQSARTFFPAPTNGSRQGGRPINVAEYISQARKQLQPLSRHPEKERPAREGINSAESGQEFFVKNRELLAQSGFEVSK